MTQIPEPVLRFRAFGGISLLNATGEPIDAATAQKRPVALAAALAVAGDTGMSRDKLLGLLWAESDSSRARHSLTQAMYSLRRAANVDDLFITTGQIRLNRSRISSDVGDLERHLDAGELESAVELYTGPFLDGFFVTSAAEFEDWSSRQRSRLENRVVDALETLAARAERESDFARAVGWRERQAMHRPLDSDIAAKLALALARSGDRAGAIRSGRAHEAVLREQLEIAPDAVFTTLMEQLRTGDWTTSRNHDHARFARAHGFTEGLAERSPRGSVERPAEESAERSVKESVERYPDAAPAWAPRSRWRARRTLAGAAIALSAAAAAVLGIAFIDSQRAVETGTARGSVLIAPFDASGADPSLSYMYAGIARLLPPRVADESLARPIHESEVPTRWRPVGGASLTVPVDSIVSLATRLGATEVIVGVVVGSPTRMVVNATMLALPSGRVVARSRSEGPADSIASLVDRLASRLLIARAGEDTAFAARWSSSMRALRRFLAGRVAYAQGDYSGAVGEYEAALRADSGFAAAALDLASAAKHLGDPDRMALGLSQAWEHRDRFTVLEQATFAALAGPNYPRPSTVAEQLAAWDRVLRLAPGRAESWYEWGTQLLHDGRRLGSPATAGQAAVVLNRTLAVNPDHAPARVLLTQLRLRDRTGESVLERAPPVDVPAKPGFLDWRRAIAEGDSSALKRVRGAMERMDRSQVRSIAMSSQFDAAGMGDGLRAVRELASRATNTSDLVDAILGEHALMLNAGRTREALAATERLRELRPDSYAHLRLRILDALYGGADMTTGSAAASELSLAMQPAMLRFPTARRQRSANECVLSQWRLAQGDTASVRGMIDSLRARSGREAALVGSTPVVCADLVEATLAVAIRRRDALGLVERLDSLVLTSSVAGTASQYSHILLSRLFVRLGKPARALETIQRRGYMSGWPAYLGTALREESRLATQAGDRTLAQESRRRSLALRRLPLRLLAQVDSSKGSTRGASSRAP